MAKLSHAGLGWDLKYIHQKDFFKKGKGQLIFDSIVQYLKNS